jgi:hypothetical protein
LTMSQHKYVGFTLFGSGNIFAMQRIVALTCFDASAHCHIEFY